MSIDSKKLPVTQEQEIEKDFWFDLTNEEMAMKGQDAAEAAVELFGVEREFQSVKKDFKAQIDRIVQRRDDILATIREGREERTVKVKMVKNFDEKKISYFFKGELLEEREMSDSELQLELEALENEEKVAVLDKARDKKKAEQDQKDADEAAEKAKQEQEEAESKESKDKQISDVIKEETSSKTKKSSVDVSGIDG